MIRRGALRRLALVAWLVTVPGIAEAACRSGAKPEVFIKAKSPLRRGPGLNYGVSAFLERGKCLGLVEASIDESWVLVEGAGVFGWVPVSRLDAVSKEKVAAMKVARAPVGSGQQRGYVWTNATSSLREGSDRRSAQKKVLPQGTPLLPLMVTGDGTWVEVRDDRGEIGWVLATRLRDETGLLAGVPRSTNVLERVEVPVAAEPRTVLVPMTGRRGVLIDALLLGAAMSPNQTLESNGAMGFRRYELSAFAGGARIEAGTTSIEPLMARVSYAFTIIAGVKPEGEARAISGRQHEARMVLGVPLELGRLRVIPELGYGFWITDLDSDLPGERRGGAFISTQQHAGSAGLSLALALVDALSLDVEAAALVGVTEERIPGTAGGLGDSGPTFGALGGVGLRYGLTDDVGLALRWDFRLRRTTYEGISEIDATITEASLQAFDHGLFAGLTFSL